jgi:hypothetical protein
MIFPNSSGCLLLSVFLSKVQSKSRTCCKMVESTTEKIFCSVVGLYFSLEESMLLMDSLTLHSCKIVSLLSSLAVEL